MPGGDHPAIPRLHTERLLLRAFLEADRAPFAAVNADPEVAATLSRVMTRDDSDAFADAIERHWREDGFGLWAIERLSDGAFIGFAGLSVPSWSPFEGVEIGWRLARDAWGHGYATEAARAVLAWTFETLGLEELISMTAVVNVRSQAVMERIGLVRDPTSDFAHPRLPADHPVSASITYRLRRDEWLASR